MLYQCIKDNFLLYLNWISKPELSFILKFSSGEDSLPPPTDPSGIFSALETILQPRGRRERSRGGRGRGQGPGRPPLHKRGPGRPPLNSSRIIAKGRSMKDDIPTTCYLCHLDIEEEEVDSLVDCRNCRKLGSSLLPSSYIFSTVCLT